MSQLVINQLVIGVMLIAPCGIVYVYLKVFFPFGAPISFLKKVSVCARNFDANDLCGKIIRGGSGLNNAKQDAFNQFQEDGVIVYTNDWPHVSDKACCGLT